MDGLGNRKGMDVSFWLVESLTVGGSSYTSGLEAARYHSASGTLQVQYGTNIWQIGGFVSARYRVCATGLLSSFCILASAAMRARAGRIFGSTDCCVNDKKKL